MWWGRRGFRLQRLGRRLAVGLVLALCLSACQVTITVGIDAKSDGTGSVTVSAKLDRAAARAVPDLATELRTTDLVQAGWRISGPTPVAGGVVVTATKPFGDPSEAQQIIAEISGTKGPFHDLRLTRVKSLYRTRTTFSGTVDLTCGIACFADPQLQSELGGSTDLGLDPTKLRTETGVDIDRLLQFDVEVRLPGTVKASNAPQQVGSSVQWQPRMGQKLQLTATSQTWNRRAITATIVAAAVGVVLVVLLLVLGVKRLRRWRRSRPAHAHKGKKSGHKAKVRAKVKT